MTITRDQTATGQSVASGTTVVLIWATSPTAGAKALVFAGTTSTISSVKDNGATQSTFTQDALLSSSGQYAVYRADGITLPASGSYTVTVTLAGSAFSMAGGRTYLGVATGAPTATNHGTGSGTAIATGNVTPAVTGAVVFGGFTDATGLDPETITLTTSGGANAAYTSTNGNDLCGGVADNIVTTTTPQGLAWTIGDSEGWTAAVAVYSPASAPAANPGAFFSFF